MAELSLPDLLDGRRPTQSKPSGPDDAMTRTALFAEALQQLGYAYTALTGNMRPGGITDMAGKPLNPGIIFEIAKREGLTTAKSLEEFRGNEAITRAEAATVLVRSTGEQVNSAEEGLQRAVDLGLFNSVGDGNAAFQNDFLPDVLDRGQGVLPERPTRDEDVRGPDGNVVRPPGDGAGTPAPAVPAQPPENPAQPGGLEPAPPVNEPTTPTNVTEDPAVVDAETEQEAQNSLTIIRDQLSTYGFEGAALNQLVDLAYGMLIKQTPNENILIQLAESQPYKDRFKGMQMRDEAGLAPISAAEYIALERSYKQTMMAAGIPESFYDEVDELAGFIGGDVSQAEFTERVSMATAAVQGIDPNLKGQLQDMYGVGVENDGELIAFYLDPDRGTSVIEQRLQMEAAGLSSAAMGTLGQGFNVKTAERLADLNVQKREVTERMKDQAGLRTQLLGEQGAATSSELAAATFGLDSEATANIRRLRQKRQGVGTKKSGAVIGQAGVVGLGRGT